LLRILIVGKYPPIQGGTSNQTLATVRSLLQSGHTIDVLTNANEVELCCRQVFIADDGSTLQALHSNDSGGTVAVHQTTRLEHTSLIPWAQPYASKLFGLGMELVRSHQFDLIVGWYLEPYGLVAAQIAEIAGVPLLLRHAGSDIGRLAQHPDLRSAYRWAFAQAQYVLTGPGVRDMVVDLGADPERLLYGTRSPMPDYFSQPFSPIDLAEVAEPAIAAFEAMRLPEPVTRMLVENLQRRALPEPVIGVYGKVAHSKGSYDLISALEMLAEEGTAFTLLGAVGGQRRLLLPFLEAVAATRHLRQRVVLLPFLAPWRVPRLLDACDLVCFLERDFDIDIHRPRVPREVLTRGRALVLSGQIADTLRFRRHLADGENYLRVDDPSDVPDLAQRLGTSLSDLTETRRIAMAGATLVSTLLGAEDPDGPASAIARALAQPSGGNE
jgi:glycosyltransferase involved in cell wall biosynthesis